MNACRVCVVEVEARVRSCPRARDRSRTEWSSSDDRSASDERRLVLELLGSSVDLSHRAGHRPRWPRTARTGTLGPTRPRSRSRRRSTTSSTCATTRSASSATSASRRAAEDAEHVRDHRRRPRLRRAHLDRVRRAAARVGVRLLWQLHRGLPHRGADVPSEYDIAQGGRLGRVPQTHRHDLPLLRVGCNLTCTSRTTRSSRSRRRSITT